MEYLRETSRLCQLLQAAGVPVRVLKGVPLSQQVYGDPALRDVGDIDLLIAPDAEEIADDVLLADEFTRTEPAARLTPARRRSWRRHGKDYTYAGKPGGFEVDLHWRLFRNPRMPGNALAMIEPGGEEHVRFGELSFATVPVLHSFLYLCIHGAIEGWLRFKSLADVAALWSGFTDEQKEEAIRCARVQQVLPEMASALLFAESLHLLVPSSLTPAMQLAANSREARHILDYAWQQQTTHAYRPTSEEIGSWALKRYEFDLRRGGAYRAEIVRRVLFRPRVWELIDLPDALFPLYALLSPIEWVLFHGRQQGSSDRVESRRESRVAKWRRLPMARRLLLLEAFASLVAARVALALLPVRVIFRWLGSPLRRARARAQSDIAEQVRWAVLTAARYGPGTFVCFPQALAAHAMLRRRGIPSVMHYGVRRSLDQQLRAHTWLEVGERMLLGGEGAPLFVPVHSSGPASTQPPTR